MSYEEVGKRNAGAGQYMTVCLNSCVKFTKMNKLFEKQNVQIHPFTNNK